MAAFACSARAGQAAPSGQPVSFTRLCTISFGRDAQRPARVPDNAEACLARARQAFRATPGMQLYLVATADRVKDNNAGHGTARTEQDMSGEDLRYADVAAYRAVNTKAYLVRWLGMDARSITPLTTYEDGQWLAIYLVPRAANFKVEYDKATAAILARPCTVPPCATGDEEFLIAQQRTRISQR